MNEMANFTDFSKKQEIWSSSNNNDDFYEFDPQQKLKKVLSNPKEECIIVGEYSVEPDRFEKLKKSSKCQMPLWLTFLLAFIGIMLAITALAAILITSLAKNYASYNENCDSTRMCDTEKNLNCSNGICVCGSSSLIWISSYSKCILRKSYGESCLSTSECADLTGLFCATSPSGCNCPSTSVANMCDCQLTQFYDQTQKKCVNRISYNSSCTFTEQCELGKNFACISSAICGCSDSYYYSGSVCVAKSLNGEACSSSIPCDDTKGLTCSALGTCECSASHYFDSSTNKCALKKTILEGCSSISECGTDLICENSVCKCSNNNFWSQGSSGCINCPSGYDLYQNSICSKIDSSSSWGPASCSSDEQLFVASSDAEFDLLQSYLTDKPDYGPFWVGASKNGSDFKWLDNTILSASSYFWCAGEPNTGDCVMITYENAEFCLRLEVCNTPEKFICKKIS